jgi:hypothetical protein
MCELYEKVISTIQALKFTRMQILAIVVMLFICISELFIDWIPPSTVVILLLTFFSVVMTLDVLEKKQKTVWIVIVAALTLIALHAIFHEGSEQLAQQKAVLKKINTAAKLAKDNLAALTGEGSYPCIVPQSHAVIKAAIPLFVWNRGINPLTGVEIKILSSSEFINIKSRFLKPFIDIGTLRSGWGKPLPYIIYPKLGKDGTANYTADIWTQNGFYVESINFRRGKYMLPWAYRYRLIKVHVMKNMTMNEIMKECVTQKWSDDLGDGKPTTTKP